MVVPGDAFLGDDEPGNIDGDSDDVLKVLLGNESDLQADDVVEPVLDD